MWLSMLIASIGFAASGAEFENCKNKLGMQSREIPDAALTASSSYDVSSVGPTNARIRTETNGGAWCPKQLVSEDTYEYLEIDLNQLRVITATETQGRFGNGQGLEYADQYLLDYQREDGGVWFRFHNRQGQQIIPGNSNTYISELREVDPPIIARRIRFVPYSTEPRLVCMRMELYGCDWPDGVVAYSMTQGEQWGSDVDLHDSTYDGSSGTGNTLTGGLGLLTDGEHGQTNFRLDPQWVGWQNETFRSSPIEIIFKFDAIRNFSNVQIYSNNMFSKEIRVFRKARISFSVGGEHFLGEPIQFHYVRDGLIEYSRFVIIPLHNGIGQYVKIQLFFDSRWILISEVRFESDYATGSHSAEIVPSSSDDSVVILPGITTPYSGLIDIDVTSDPANRTNHSLPASTSRDDPDVTSVTTVPADEEIQATSVTTVPADEETQGVDKTTLLIVALVVGGVVIIAVTVTVAVTVVMVTRKKSNKNRNDDLQTSVQFDPTHDAAYLTPVPYHQLQGDTDSTQYGSRHYEEIPEQDGSGLYEEIPDGGTTSKNLSRHQPNKPQGISNPIHEYLALESDTDVTDQGPNLVPKVAGSLTLVNSQGVNIDDQYLTTSNS